MNTLRMYKWRVRFWLSLIGKHRQLAHEIVSDSLMESENTSMPQWLEWSGCQIPERRATGTLICIGASLARGWKSHTAQSSHVQP